MDKQDESGATLQTQQIFAASNASLASGVILAVILAVIQRNVIDAAIVAVWFSVLMLISLARAAQVAAYKRASLNRTVRISTWLTWFRAGVLASGLAWGSTAFFLFPDEYPQHQMFLIFVLVGLTAGAVISYSADLISASVYSAALILPLAIRLLAAGDGVSVAMAMAALLYLGFMIMSLRHINQNIRENILLRLEATAKEHAIKVSEERFRLLLSHSPVGIFHYDTRLIITYCNDRFARILNSAVERIVGLDMKLLKAQAILPSLKKALAGESDYYEGAYAATFSDANIRIAMTSAPSRDSLGEITGGIAVVKDITTRWQMAEDLKQQLKFTEALNKISGSLTEFDDPALMLEKTVQTAGEVLGADRALIYEITQSSATALCEWLNPEHPDIESAKTALAPHLSAAAEMWDTRQALISQADDINPHFISQGSGELLHQQIHSLLWYPFAFRVNSHYLLALNQIHSKKTWDRKEIDFLNSALRQVSIALEKLRLIHEQKLAENDLRIAAIAFEAKEGMLITDAHNTVLRVNRTFTHITGYTSEEIVGRNPRLLSSGEQTEIFYSKMWDSITNSDTWEGEIRNRRKNGEIYPAFLTITAVKDANGCVTNYVATFNDITASRAAADEIQQLEFYDSLTGLPNRRLLMDRLHQALASSTRSGRRGALLFLDLDNFKTLNDTLGHEIGDLLLQQVARRLESCVHEDDTVARLGGDEFVILLEDLGEQVQDAATQAEDVGEKILLALNQPYRLATHQCRSTPSIGATLFNNHQNTIEDLMKQADIAMYQAKKAGRNTLRFFDPVMQEAINVRARLEIELRTALENRQFHLYYQIQVDSSRKPIGAETLIRWTHPERGIVSPAQFIPLMEETDLILPVGLWVLDAACAQLKAWQPSPLTRDLVLAVNVSAKQFRQLDFVAEVQKAVQRHAIDATRLKLELTESLLLENIGNIVDTMNTLNEIGVQFSLDDFGTGYSSLQYLKQLPLDQLKIDQSFVRDINTESSDKTIVRTIIAMAKSLNLDVIAEGVETEEQRQRLINKGCLHFQGYLFGEPMPIEQFEALLARS